MDFFIWKLAILALCIGQSAVCHDGMKIRFPDKRSYQVPFPLVHTGQPLQYISGSPLFAAVPAVLVSDQIGLSASPVSNILTTQQELPNKVPPFGEVPEKPNVDYFNLKTGKTTSRIYQNQNVRVPDGHQTRHVINSISSSRRKPGVQSQKPFPKKITNYNVNDVHGQDEGSAYSSTFLPTTSSSKTFYHQKMRVPSKDFQTVYYRPRGTAHRHSAYGSKKFRVHAHNDHFGPKHKHPVSSSPGKPSMSFPSLAAVSPTSTTYGYGPGPDMAFANAEDPFRPSPEFHLPQESQNRFGGITQAILKNPGTIDNYDASLPLQVPAQNQVPSQMNLQALQHPYELYGFVDSTPYPTNHLIPDQDLGHSETVKIPVAVIRGVSSATPEEMLGFAGKSRETKAGESSRESFTPSRRTSDWIPVPGSAVLIGGEKMGQERLGLGPNGRAHAHAHAHVPQAHVEEIISGKIPKEFTPKLNYQEENEEMAGRKVGGAIVHPAPSDTSDLVVSSVIKFS